MAMIVPTCFWLEMQLMARAAVLALCKAGRSRPARIAMMAITTRSSIRVNPLAIRFRLSVFFILFSFLFAFFSEISIEAFL